MVPIRRYIVTWCVIAVGFGTLLAISEYYRNPLNDPDPAQQRTGMLLAPRAERAPTITDVHELGRRRVILFARSLKDQYLFHDLADQADLAEAAEVIVVTVDGSQPIITNGISAFRADADGELARAFGMAEPIDRGAPIGYVILDSEGYIRYRTLDPLFMHHGRELRMMVGATP